jgi:hypothetical protein
MVMILAAMIPTMRSAASLCSTYWRLPSSTTTTSISTAAARDNTATKAAHEDDQTTMTVRRRDRSETIELWASTAYCKQPVTAQPHCATRITG